MKKIGRNAPCPCGSGKKYKKCCLRGDRPVAPSLASIYAELEELDALSNSVVDMLRTGRFREAEEVCRRLLREYPDQVDGLERMAMTCAAQGHKKEAAEWYRKAHEFMRSHDGYDQEFIAEALSKAEKLEAELDSENERRKTPSGEQNLRPIEQLDDILAALIELSADKVTLEWDSEGIEVSMYHGSMGVGGVLARPLAGAIMEEVISRAKLEEKSRGFLQAEIDSEKRKFTVEEYDHFGECAFEIRPRAYAGGGGDGGANVF